ncbi:MAG: hypothetical protein HYY96_03690 [Candidatus Tectomicrobia bacterium]|nr:hypothetical protein [Candidatus Tectomicrobia bacterium]
MQHALDQFRQNLERVRNMRAIYLSMSTMVTKALDLSDLLRAEIVMVVSALDHYIHELSRLGMVQAYEGKRNPTPAFLKFGISLESTLLIKSGTSGTAWLDTEIRTKHSFLSFQHPDKIADAVRLFSDIELWNLVSQELNDKPQNVKTRINLLVDRRNKIAHEADIDPSYPGSRWPIDSKMVEEAIDFVSTVCEAIHRVAA